MVTKHDVKLFFIYNTTANSFSSMLYMGPVVNPSFRSKSMPALDYREKGRAGGFSLAVILKASSSP
jgi:hypothetical protein